MKHICPNNKDDEKMDDSSVTPFEIHYNQGNNRDEHKAGALFIHEEEERQSKYNKKPEESSQGFDHREAQMVFFVCSW